MIRGQGPYNLETFSCQSFSEARKHMQDFYSIDFIGFGTTYKQLPAPSALFPALGPPNSYPKCL